MRLLAVAFLILPVLAQEAPPVFTASTNNVLVDVAVTSDRRPLSNLQREDFVVLDNGQPRPVTGFSSEELPLDIVLVCRTILVGRAIPPDPQGREPAHYRYGPEQTDASLRLMNAAANAVLGARPTDRVAMVRYGRDPHIELRFTNDRKAIASAIKRFSNPDNADENVVLTSEALAIEYAIRMLADVERDDPNVRAHRRRLIILVSNVFGVGTRYADEPIIRRLWDQDVVLSVIDDARPSTGTTNVQRSDGGESQSILFRRYNPIHIAQATGGDRIVALDSQNPGDLLTPIRQRYLLSFHQPTDVPAGETHAIKVELSGSAQRRFPGAAIRAREGYVSQ